MAPAGGNNRLHRAGPRALLQLISRLPHRTRPSRAANPVAKQALQPSRDKQTAASSSSKQPPSVQPLSALPPSAPTQTAASASTAPAVLPSPAPSDEPSPAVSATPYEALSPSNGAPANPPPSTTEARFEALPARVEAFDVAQPLSGNALPNGSIAPSSGEVRPMSASTTSTALLAASAGTSLQTPPTPSIPTFSHATTSSAPGREQENPAKRRRMVSGLTLLQALQALPVLDVQIRQSGGVEALEPGVERPRYQLLREACEDGDIFFVVLHQIFCLWSSSPRETHKLYIQGIHDPALIDSAFGQMSTILKSNSLIRSEQLSWLVQFPGPLDVLRNAFPEYSRVVRAVLDFLVRLTQFWMVVNNEHRKQGYPLLVDEMLSTFQLYSTVLQTIVFRASRRTCGITDGPVGAQMDKLFKEDQAQHRQPNGSFMVRTTRDFHKEPINQNIIQKYQELAARMQMSNNAAYMPYSISPDLRQQAFQQQQRLNNSSPLQVGTQLSRGSFGQTASAPNTTSAGPSPVISTAHIGSPSSRGDATSPLEQQNQTSLTPVPAQFQLYSNTANAQSASGNGQQSPANHSPVIAQGHFNQPQQILGFQQPSQMHHQHSSVLRRPSQNYVQTANGRSPQLQNIACVPSQVHNGHFSPANGQATVTQNRQSRQNQPAAHASPPLQSFMQSPVPSPQMSNMNLPMSASTPAGNMPRNIAPAGAVNPSGNQDYPHDPYDRKSVANALHQADIRSPKRVLSGAFKFANNESLSNDEHARISRDAVRSEDSLTLPFNVFSNGSLRLRLRCVCRKQDVVSISEAQWVKEDTTWPDQIFMQLNGRTLTIRRKQHYAQEQPIEIGHCVSPGLNELKISVPPNVPNGRVWPPNKKPFIAVEVVETLSHSFVLALNNLTVGSTIPAEHTLSVIRKRLGGPSGDTDDDDIAIVASDLTIKIADPFSFCIFNIPVRGANCEHLECFDLETWLNTRPSKKSCVCGSKDANCKVCPREPSFADKWKCPICGEDARPQVLRIDGFLSEVRAALASQGRLATKDIAVSADGSWKPMIDADDGEGDDDSDVETAPAIARSPRSRSASKPMPQRAPVEVITLDDD
ncbi:hypothetical protein PG996_013046 [Apiospora saccharicola]|uniref:SP-RING-type domain-containing protein n=1 Tax=Apiospora saccharicola TaxID=335842 RepID=A0ABR1U4E1_9PEZI